MMALPTFLDILFIGVGFLTSPIGQAIQASELQARLFEACDDSYSYELAAWVLQAGADVNAVSPDGETALQQLFRRRYGGRGSGRYDDNATMVVLLLKNGAVIPADAPPDKNPVRMTVNMMDQIMWDILCLKFGEEELTRLGAWQSEVVATLALTDRSAQLPAPEGFVPAAQPGLEKVLTLASRSRLDPAAAALFVPAEQADLPAAEVTRVAAFVNRQDLLGLTGDNEALHQALSLSDDIHGRFFKQYFNNCSYELASPTTPVPWLGRAKDERDEDDETLQVIVSSHGSLGQREPYQLVLYTIYPTEDDFTDDAAMRAHGLLAAWHLMVRSVNASPTAAR